jgi:preprotein translocase subunit SecE
LLVAISPDKILLMAKDKTLKKGNVVTSFIGEVREEMRHVTWPTRAEAIQKTVIVIGISVMTGVYLGALDYLFTQMGSYIYK